ncbi:MAG: TRAP transporter substrate-binding protein [Desulfobacterales bacterium]|nr:TRAP transporter substrate-binding protein [Desulfobacterales bacterium]
MKKSCFLVLLVSITLVSAQAFGADFVMKFGISQPQGSDRATSMEYFAAEVEKRSGGKLKVENYFGAVLGNEREMMDMVATGALQGTRGGMFVDANPKMVIFMMPFLVNGWDQATKLVQSDWAMGLAKEAEKNGYHIPAIGVSNGFRAWSNNIKPITSAEDFSGLRIRVPQQEVYQLSMKSFGANPIAMAYSDVYQALQTNVLDGQDNAPANIYDYKIYEQQKYVTISNYATGPDPFMVSLEWYKKLPADLQKIHDDVAKEAMKLCDELQQKHEGEIILKLAAAENVVSLNYVKAAALKDFQKRAKPVYDHFIKRGDFTQADLDAAMKAASGM